MSWTSDFVGLSLSNFHRIAITLHPDMLAGAVSEAVDLGFFARNDERMKWQYRAIQVYHDMLCAPQCTTYGDYGVAKPFEVSILIGAFRVTKKGDGGQNVNKVLPIAIFPDFRFKRKSDNVEVRAFVNGYEAGGVIGALANKGFSGTLCHEFMHGVREVFPEIEAAMYGGSPADVREETLVHMISDHLDKFVSIKNDISVETEIVTPERTKNTRYSCEISNPIDLVCKGKAVSSPVHYSINEERAWAATEGMVLDLAED